MKLSLIDEKAQWREQFPVDLADDEYRSRRDFTRLLGLTSLAFVVGQVWIVARSVSHKVKGLWPRLAVSRVGDLPVGGTKLFHYPGENDPCVLVRLTKDNWVAYGQKCTHLSCPVIPQPERGPLAASQGKDFRLKIISPNREKSAWGEGHAASTRSRASSNAAS